MKCFSLVRIGKAAYNVDEWKKTFYTVSEKNIHDVIDCNLRNDDPIVIIFGTNVDKTSHQMTINVPTSYCLGRKCNILLALCSEVMQKQTLSEVENWMATRWPVVSEIFVSTIIQNLTIILQVTEENAGDVFLRHGVYCWKQVVSAHRVPSVSFANTTTRLLVASWLMQKSTSASTFLHNN